MFALNWVEFIYNIGIVSAAFVMFIILLFIIHFILETEFRQIISVMITTIIIIAAVLTNWYG